MINYENTHYDIYVDNCFYRRVHYAGLIGKIQKELSDKGHIVKVVTVIEDGN